MDDEQNPQRPINGNEWAPPAPQQWMPSGASAPAPAPSDYGVGVPQPPTVPAPAVAAWPGGETFQLFGAGDARVTLSETTTTKGPSGFGRAALAGVLAVTVGLGGLAVRSALSEPTGASSPEAAFEAFFAAVDSEDLAGVIETMPSNEREAVVDPMGAIMVELARLGVIDPEATASDVSGVDFSVTGLTYSVEQLDPRLAVITTTGGSLEVSGLSMTDLPLGPVVDEQMARLRADAVDDLIAEPETNDLAANPVSLAVIEDDGWHVTMMYSIAEAARRESGAAFPGLGNGPAPVGADSPEAAVRQALEEALDLDLGGVISMLDPNEMAMLYDYSPLFLAEADASAAQARTELTSVSLDRLDTRVIERDGRTMVAVDGGRVSLTLFDPWDETTSIVTADFDGDCYEVVIDDETEQGCLSDLRAELGIAANPSVTPFGGPEQGLTVVERGGRWFLSVMPSMLYPVADGLASLDDDAITSMIADVENMLDDPTLGSGLGLPWLFGLSAQEQFMSVGNGIDGETPAEFADIEPSEDSAAFDDTETFESAPVQNFLVLVDIPAGTSADDLVSGGFVSAFDVPGDEADFATVWEIEFEIGGLVAGRDIAANEVLMVGDFVNP